MGCHIFIFKAKTIWVDPSAKPRTIPKFATKYIIIGTHAMLRYSQLGKAACLFKSNFTSHIPVSFSVKHQQIQLMSHKTSFACSWWGKNDFYHLFPMSHSFARKIVNIKLIFDVVAHIQNHSVARNRPILQAQRTSLNK